MNRISTQEGLELLCDAPLLELGQRADQAAAKLNGGDRVRTFAVDRNINTTNVCASRCRFCAFCRPAGTDYLQKTFTRRMSMGQAANRTR